MKSRSEQLLGLDRGLAPFPPCLAVLRRAHPSRATPGPSSLRSSNISGGSLPCFALPRRAGPVRAPPCSAELSLAAIVKFTRGRNRALPNHATPRPTVPRPAPPSNQILWWSEPCLALPGRAMPRHALPCHALLRSFNPCGRNLALPGRATPCRALPCHALLCRAPPRRALLRSFKSIPVVPCLAMPCQSCPGRAMPSIAAPRTRPDQAVSKPGGRSPRYLFDRRQDLALPCLALPSHARPCRACPCSAMPSLS